MTRWNGSYLGNLKNTSLQDSGGIWNLKRQTLAKQNAIWPIDNSIIPIPSWTLDFSSGTPSGYTLTRSGTGATFVNSSGYIQAAGENVARLTHDSSGTRLGLLVEESRTNLCPTSETTADVASNTAVTTSNTGPAPDNANTAELMSEVVANGTHHCGTKNTTANVDLDSLYVYSVFLKRPASNATQYAVLTFLYGTSDRRFTQVFDLSAGSTSGCATRSRTTPVDTSSGIEAYANGWYRCWVSHRSRSTNEGIGQGIVQFSDSATPGTWVVDTYPSYNVTSAKDMLVWGHQIEKGATPSAYISNTGTGSTTRSADLAHILDENITSWGTPGALVIHFYQPGQAGTLISTDDATNQQLGIKANTTTTASSFWSSGETSTETIGSINVNKAVHYWDGTTSKFCINGGSVVSETNNITTFSNIDYITLGAEATSSTSGYSQYANCIIRKVEFYSGALQDSDLQLITNNTYPIEYLVIAGGGGGGGGNGGSGGGAGGYRTATGFSLTVGQSYTVTVGAGGASATSGNNSVFDTITSTGGGRGGTYLGAAAANGGSGGGAGGASGNVQTPGTGTSGQGNDGGANQTSSPYGCGGGGGASAVGGAPAGNTAGAGGAGTASSITGSSVTRAGGGGGGAHISPGTGGAGGSGGGGAGGAPSGNGSPGSANTGGGGGGTNTGNGGGSGVVILRIPTINYTGIIIGNPTVTTDGDFTILTFNGSGSYTA